MTIQKYIKNLYKGVVDINKEISYYDLEDIIYQDPQ